MSFVKFSGFKLSHVKKVALPLRLRSNQLSHAAVIIDSSQLPYIWELKRSQRVRPNMYSRRILKCENAFLAGGPLSCRICLRMSCYFSPWSTPNCIPRSASRWWNCHWLCSGISGSPFQKISLSHLNFQLDEKDKRIFEPLRSVGPLSWPSSKHSRRRPPYDLAVVRRACTCVLPLPSSAPEPGFARARTSVNSV